MTVELSESGSGERKRSCAYCLFWTNSINFFFASCSLSPHTWQRVTWFIQFRRLGRALTDMVACSAGSYDIEVASSGGLAEL